MSEDEGGAFQEDGIGFDDNDMSCHKNCEQGEP